MLRFGQFSRHERDILGYFPSHRATKASSASITADSSMAGRLPSGPHERLDVLVGNVFAGISQLMYDVVLDLRAREHPIDCSRKTRQIVRASDENVLYAPISVPIEYHHPELYALVFTHQHPQHVFPAIQIHAQCNIDCLLRDLSFAANVVVDGIQKHHCVDQFQGVLLPFLRNGEDFDRDPADGGVGVIYTVDVLNVCFNVALYLSSPLFLDTLTTYLL